MTVDTMSLTEPSIIRNEPALVWGSCVEPPQPTSAAATSATRSAPFMTRRRHWVRYGPRARLEGVGREDFAARLGAQRPPDADVDRVLGEPDRAVAQQQVHAAGVVAPRGRRADLVGAVVEALAGVAV